MRNPTEFTPLPTDPETANALAITGGGAAGSLAALSIKQPKTVREGVWRTVAGIIFSLAFTGFACEQLTIQPDRYHKVVSVGVAVGFIGWHIMTIAMNILDGMVKRAGKDGPEFLVALIQLIRGKTP